MTNPQVTVDYNSTQKQTLRELLLKKTKEIHLISGVGGGKSFLGATWIYMRAMIPGSVHFIGAPTIPQLRNSTFRATMKAWSALGLVEGVHYVVNERPPWSGVKPYSKLGSDKVVTFRNGSYVILGGLDNYDSIRGAEYDSIWIDEYGLTYLKEVREVAKDRLRGSVYLDRDLKHQILFTATPPDKSDSLIYLRELRDVEQVKNSELTMVFGRTKDNQEHLPKDYIDEHKDPITYRREYEASLEVAAGNLFAFAFSREKHIAKIPDNSDWKVMDNPKYHLYFSHDFNATPMTALVCQHTTDKKQIRILDEIFIENSDVYEMGSRVKTYIPNLFRAYFTGDSSGTARIALKKGMSNWTALRSEIGCHTSQIKILTRNPFDVDYSQLLNSILHQHTDFQIHPRCKRLIRDLELVQRGNDGEIVEPDALSGHLFDCLKYYLWTFHYDFLRKFAEQKQNFKNVE